jgi:hypothetical protein
VPYLPVEQDMTFKDSSRYHCAVCDGEEWLSGSYVYNRDPVCTCAAGSRDDELVLHAPDCDSVPCPFCQLLGESVHQVA